MRIDGRVRAQRVVDEAGRQRAITVLRATYEHEKRWVADAEGQIPASDLEREDVAWFEALLEGVPVGVVRVLFDPPLAVYAQYGFEAVDPNLDINEFISRHRIAEIGRFAVVPTCRGQIGPAAALMRAATADTVARGYTHFITDVFEQDPHSPFGFHTRVMGFTPVATHAHGELHCASKRITLVLDLRAAYQRLRRRSAWFFRYLTAAWPDTLHRRLAA